MQLFNLTGYATVNQRKFQGRIAFNIEQLAGGSCSGNTKIDFFNLSAESRNWLETNHNRGSISLFAGYQGDNRLIFQGTYITSPTERDGTELKTSVTCAPALRLVQRAHVAFSGATDDAQVFECVLDEVKKFGYVRGHYSQAVQEILKSRTYSRPYSDSGLVSHILDDLVRRNRLGWKIQNGALDLTNPAAYEDQDEFYLSKSTGLIGFPSKDLIGIYKLTSLFNPELATGRKVLVDSTVFKATTELKINSLIHTGDTWRGGGKTEMEAVPLGTRNFLVMK